MNIRSRRVALIALTLIVSMLFASISYANENIKDYMSLSEAKEYLLSYEKVTIVEGREIVTTYEFADEKSLDKAATYISENGLNAFNSMLDEGIRKQVATEQRNAPILRTTTPSTGHAQVSKNNGTYHVKSNASGLVSFDKLGTLEYSLMLGYDVTVKNKKFTAVNNIDFDIPYVSRGGSWGSLNLSSYTADTSAGVTANYKLTKKLTYEGITIKSETKSDLFALLTTFK